MKEKHKASKSLRKIYETVKVCVNFVTTLLFIFFIEFRRAIQLSFIKIFLMINNHYTMTSRKKKRRLKCSLRYDSADQYNRMTDNVFPQCLGRCPSALEKPLHTSTELETFLLFRIGLAQPIHMKDVLK